MVVILTPNQIKEKTLCAVDKEAEWKEVEARYVEI